MRFIRLLLSGVLMAGPLVAHAQTQPGVTVLDNPGGGSIAFAQLPAQHSVQGAMGKILQSVHSRFGARPQIVHVMRGRDGNSLALTFTVKPVSGDTGDIAGLALVIVSPSAPAKAAVLVDRADRFRNTVRPMLQRLEALGGGQRTSTAASSTQPANQGPLQTPPSPSARPTPTSVPATASVPTKAAAASKTQPMAPAAKLHVAQFPDGTGSVGLPDGWTITGAHTGEVVARGPGPAGMHFFWQFTANDRGHGLLGNALQIPYGTDAGATLKAVFTQLAERQHHAAPSFDILANLHLVNQEYFVVVNVGAIADQPPLRAWAHVVIGPPNDQGNYQITLYVINVPLENADQTQGTAVAMFSSYKLNNAAVVAQIHSQMQRDAQWFARQQSDFHAREAAQDRQFASYQRQQDVQERQFAAFDNGLLNNTVVFDKELNGHGTVADDLADALVKADPNRFEEVPASGYVKGIDY